MSSEKIRGFGCVSPPFVAGSQQRSGVTIIELLIVVAILGVFSMFLVPVAEIITIRLKEAEFETNMGRIRQAIYNWRREAGEAAERYVRLSASDGVIFECYLFPPDIASLTQNRPHTIRYSTTGRRSGSFIFYPRRYLNAIPSDPFARNPVWMQHYASGTATTIWQQGRVDIPGNVGTGVFDVSAASPAAIYRAGFETAIDGTRYFDW